MESLGVRFGSVVGAVFGLVFVLVNAGGLPGSLVLRVLAVVAFAATAALVVRSRVTAPPPARSALRVYGLCVLAEVVAIVVGARLLTAADRSELVLCWVVVVVGLHFLPFARAFHAPVFLPLGAALVVIGVVAAIAVLAGADDARLVAAVVAGFVLIAAAAWGVRPGAEAAGAGLRS